ncbi:hypothetical protein [Chryseobacterium sp. StRB126]|uniref:hypothetical protein n=1 Tax=Chryseobacterium sp. StRB126 TaxID=878220 RepID=UPI000AEB27A1|nr:hypothetical protein [Chryseobacterium sp. StRB126]
MAILFGIGVYFLHGIGIEDYYGRNNHIYFEGKEGDTVVMVNNQTQQPIATGQIQRKTWNRVFIVSEKDTLDLMDWIEKEAGYMAEVDCKLKQK